MDNNAPADVVVIITRSSHPEFAYFVDVRTGARQITSRRYNAEVDVQGFTMGVVSAAHARDMLVEIRDERR